MKKVVCLSLLIAAVMFLPSQLFAQQEIGVPNQMGVDLDGNVFNLEDHVGKKNLYLVFWATWCPSCEREIPNFVETHNNVKDVHLVAINPGMRDSFERVKHYAEKQRLPYEVVFDETGQSAQAFGVYGIPTAILINKDGEVVYMGYPLPFDKISEVLAA